VNDDIEHLPNDPLKFAQNKIFDFKFKRKFKKSLKYGFFGYLVSKSLN
jgi:hypothetical protein